MIQPVNGHILIEPLAQTGFVSSYKETYEEIGVVVATANDIGKVHVLRGDRGGMEDQVKKGDKVYFDAWLAAKYPKGTDGFYWLVKWEDVRAIEYHEEISE